jgi:hypothetical protein
LATVLFLCGAHTASAHKGSDSYLTLRFGDATATGQWDIALRDLEYTVGLDADGDGVITWGEVRARDSAITAHALSRLTVAVDGSRCSLRAKDLLVDWHSDGAYAVLVLDLACPAKGTAVDIDYKLLFDVDPLHRGLLQFSDAAGTRAAVLSPAISRVRFTLNSADLMHTAYVYWREGVRHIWIGFDHVLFLLTLLLPAVLCRHAGRWRGADRIRPVVVDTIGVVTAFTVAHSITLCIAVLGVVSVPPRPVESAIAATVVLAAANNLYPVVVGRRWAIAFALGLIHGFGFATVLTDLGLPAGALAVALGAFNLGVECGQLVIVGIVVPLAYAFRATWVYRRVVLDVGSLVVAAVALKWFVERALDLGV